jgi:hypothetical protein
MAARVVLREVLKCDIEACEMFGVPGPFECENSECESDEECECNRTHLCPMHMGYTGLDDPEVKLRCKCGEVPTSAKFYTQSWDAGTPPHASDAILWCGADACLPTELRPLPDIPALGALWPPRPRREAVYERHA